MCYYIPTEELIANVLILKAESKKEIIGEVTTNIAEMIKLYEYSFEKTDGNCIFELSSKDVLSTLQSYPKYFKFSSNSNNIMFSGLIKNKEDVERKFSTPEMLSNIFKNFFTESSHLDQKVALSAG
jgi:hypothetical protein